MAILKRFPNLLGVVTSKSVSIIQYITAMKSRYWKEGGAEKAEPKTEIFLHDKAILKLTQIWMVVAVIHLYT